MCRRALNCRSWAKTNIQPSSNAPSVAALGWPTYRRLTTQLGFVTNRLVSTPCPRASSRYAIQAGQAASTFIAPSAMCPHGSSNGQTTQEATSPLGFPPTERAHRLSPGGSRSSPLANRADVYQLGLLHRHRPSLVRCTPRLPRYRHVRNDPPEFGKPHALTSGSAAMWR